MFRNALNLVCQCCGLVLLLLAPLPVFFFFFAALDFTLEVSLIRVTFHQQQNERKILSRVDLQQVDT